MQARRRWPASEPAPRVPSTRAPDATARSPTEKPSLISTTVAGTSTATHSNRVRLDVARSHTCSAAQPRGGGLTSSVSLRQTAVLEASHSLAKGCARRRSVLKPGVRLHRPHGGSGRESHCAARLAADDGRVCAGGLMQAAGARRLLRARRSKPGQLCPRLHVHPAAPTPKPHLRIGHCGCAPSVYPTDPVDCYLLRPSCSHELRGRPREMQFKCNL